MLVHPPEAHRNPTECKSTNTKEKDHKKSSIVRLALEELELMPGLQ